MARELLVSGEEHQDGFDDRVPSHVDPVTRRRAVQEADGRQKAAAVFGLLAPLRQIARWGSE